MKNLQIQVLLIFSLIDNFIWFNHRLFPPGFDLNRALGDLIKFNLTSNQWESRSYGHSPVSQVDICSNSPGLNPNFPHF